jgi:ArsR family transcriptional regulator, arsenate/arsenite/antimonite-responsive transcriptional repressor
MKEVKELSRAFQALANPNRLQIFLNLLGQSEPYLAEGKVHDCFLVSLLGNMKIGAPTVSHHIKELVGAGLIETHKEGKHLACTINPEMVDRLRALLGTRRS